MLFGHCVRACVRVACGVFLCRHRLFNALAMAVQRLICGRTRHPNPLICFLSTWLPLNHYGWMFITLVIFLLIRPTPSQYIDARGEPHVNRPLMRWEQFQRQLRLNQEQTPSPPPSLLYNALPINPGSLFPAPIDQFTPIPQYPLFASAPTPTTGSSVQWTRPIDFVAGQTGRRASSSSSSSFSPKSARTSDVNSTPTSSSGTSSTSLAAHDRVTFSPLSNATHNVTSGVQSASTVPSPQWRANMIYLSRRLTNSTLTFTDQQFASFLRLVHELSGRISTDCLSATISLFYGLRRQQQWAVQSTYRFVRLFRQASYTKSFSFAFRFDCLRQCWTLPVFRRTVWWTALLCLSAITTNVFRFAFQAN